MAPAPPYYPPPPQYTPQDQNPVYGPQAGYKHNPNDGYYGNQQQEGIQLQQPPNAYHRSTDTDYAPPPGPPPSATKPN